MKLTDEQKVVVVLLITGTVILVTQIMINEYGQVGTFITTRPASATTSSRT